ncbi:MAG: hypothetical protein M1579_06515 [Gammaproteobacteria bacterium]|nr:hypothetical protein [Gammaproteobacteria bacterium]
MKKIHDPSLQNELLYSLKKLKPYAMKKNQKIRVGNNYDGGYVLPTSVLNCDTVVSIGVGPDVSFDYVLAERGAKILQFDHTVDKTPLDHDNFTFYKKGWGCNTDGDFFDLNYINMLAEKTSLNKKMMLKFDIEGGEYDIFNSLDSELLNIYEVIAFEIHDLDNLIQKDFRSKFNDMFNKISKNHTCIHLHANNYQMPVLIEGVVVPKVVELTFLRNDLDLFVNYSSDPIPGPLDKPNNPFLPDLVLTGI